MCGPNSISVPAAAAAPWNMKAPSGAKKRMRPHRPERENMARQQPIELFMPPNMLKAKVGHGGPGLDLPLGLVDAHVSAIHVIHRDKVMDGSNKMALALTAELENQVNAVLNS